MWKKFDLESSMVPAGKVDVCRIKINGYLDSSTFPRLQDYLAGKIEEKHFHFLLDLQDLDYVSSAGLGVLMGILRQVRAEQGDLKIVNMSEKIERVWGQWKAGICEKAGWTLEALPYPTTIRCDEGAREYRELGPRHPIDITIMR